MTHGIRKSDASSFKKYSGYHSHNRLRIKKENESKQQAKSEATVEKLRTVLKDYDLLRSSHAKLVMEVNEGKSTLTAKPNHNQGPNKAFCHTCRNSYFANTTYQFENDTATLKLDGTLVHRIQKHTYCIPLEIASPNMIRMINSFV